MQLYAFAKYTEENSAYLWNMHNCLKHMTVVSPHRPSSIMRETLLVMC
jgi:hypothetical protein